MAGTVHELGNPAAADAHSTTLALNAAYKRFEALERTAML